MLDHIGFAVSDLAKSRSFYEKALAPLGIGVVMAVTKEQTGAGDAVGFGAKEIPFFWIGNGGAQTDYLHVALSAESRAEVDAFYKAALEDGGSDNGAPGLRPHYHPNYYGAFVLDLDGHNIEAVCHKPDS